MNHGSSKTSSNCKNKEEGEAVYLLKEKMSHGSSGNSSNSKNREEGEAVLVKLSSTLKHTGLLELRQKAQALA